MNSRDTPRSSPKCTCCDRSPRTENRSPCTTTSTLHHRTTQDRRTSFGTKNGAYYKNYAVPDDDDECCRRERDRAMSWGRTNQKVQVDPSTLKTLADLRQRACKLIDSSDGSTSDDGGGGCSGCGNKMESWRGENPILRRAQELSYSPQSNFLKKMRRQNEELLTRNAEPSSQCGCSVCATGGNSYRSEVPCQCCKCKAKDRGIPCKPQRTTPSEPPTFRERGGPCSDLSSMHDHCTCFRTLRPKSGEGEYTDDQLDRLGTENGTDYFCSQLFLRGLDDENDYGDGDRDECERKTPRGKKGKSGHVSRSDRRKRRKGRRKQSGDGCGWDSPETEFSPSLKRPHPNSCERCWRYASPSRSPVNRPSQRFDPNYRRSHSQVNVSVDGQVRDGPSAGVRDSRTRLVEYDPETKVHELMYSGGRPAVRARSAESVRKATDDRPQTRRCSNEKKPPRPKGGVPRAQTKKAETDAVTAKNTKAGQTKRAGNMKSCVCFEDTAKGSPRDTKPAPVQCSPSMFDRSSRRSSSAKKAEGSSRPRTASSFEAGKAKGKPKKGRSSSASQTRPSNEPSPRERPPAQVSDRRQERFGDFKENVQVPCEAANTCCCRRRRSCDQDGPPYRRGGTGCEQSSPRSSVCHSGRDDLLPKCCQRGSFDQNQNLRTYLNGCTPQSERMRQVETFSGACNCGGCFSYKSIDPNCSPRSLARAGEERSSGCRRSSPLRMAGKDFSSRGSPEREIFTKAERRVEGRLNGRNSRGGATDQLNNPRKYCVFYMNKSREDRNDDIEVLIEELTQGKDFKDSRTEALKDKMSKLQEHRLDSMALRFQKGVADKCKKQQPSNRLLYF